ncbi:MAG: hypothetical protein S4CHLAM37_11840 [Chlamydiia bacterium]|nr:hypothetical protein [Chlamydiia bacterium]
MATVSNNNQQYTTTVANQRPDSKEAGDKKGKNSKKSLEKELQKLLRTYEKGKAELWHKILEATTQSHDELEQAFENDPVSKLSDLAHALESNPQAALSSPDSIRDGSGVSKEIENFFMLIFKFLKDHKEGQSKMEISQAVNTQGKEKLLASVTKASMDSVTKMKHKIDEANKAKNGWLKIFLPIAIVLVTIICVALTVVTGGASDVAGGAADAALTAGETGTEVAVDTTATAGAEGLGTVGGDTGAALGDATADGVADGTADASTVTTDGSTVTTSTTEEGVQTLEEGGTEVADGTEETADETADETAKETAKETESKTLTQTLKNAAKKMLNKRFMVGMTTVGTATGVGFALNASAQSTCNNAIQDATSVEQGEMTVDSSASEGLQTDIRANMQYQQQEMSQTEADESQVQNVLQKQASMYTIGSFNA